MFVPSLRILPSTTNLYGTLIDRRIWIAPSEGHYPDIRVTIQFMGKLRCQPDAPEIEFRIA